MSEFDEKIFSEFVNMKSKEFDKYVDTILNDNTYHQDDINKVIHLLKYARFLQYKAYTDFKGPYLDSDRVNLLCYYLAQQNDPQYLKDILESKQCLDLFYCIDSNLLFMFSPNFNLNTCIQDSVNYWTNLKESSHLSKKLLNSLTLLLLKYQASYDQNVVIQFWNKYLSRPKVLN